MVHLLLHTPEPRLSANSHKANYDGTNQNGQPVASGIYFYRIDAGQYTQTRKMVLLK